MASHITECYPMAMSEPMLLVLKDICWYRKYYPTKVILKDEYSRTTIHALEEREYIHINGKGKVVPTKLGVEIEQVLSKRWKNGVLSAA